MSIWVVMTQVLLGDLVLPAAALDDFHAMLLQITAIRSGGQPLLWDATSVLGGYPIYAAANAGVWYPGYFAFWLLNSPFVAWHLTLVVHLLASAAMFTRRFRPGPKSFKRQEIVFYWLVMSAEAVLTLQTPATFFALPWAIWAWLSDVDQSRPAPLRIAHWMLCAGIAGLLGPAGWGTIAIAGIGFACQYRQTIPLIGVLGGGLLASFQLLPWLLQPETHDWLRLGGALLLAIRPAALLAVVLVSPERKRWWPLIVMLLAILLAVYPADFAIRFLLVLAAAAIITVIPIPKGGTWQERFHLVAGLALFMHTLMFASHLLGIPTGDLKTLVNDTRSVLPRETHPSIAVLEPIDLGVIPDSRRFKWHSANKLASYFSTSASPLLWNWAPDPDLAAAAVALPWSPRWREQLASLDALHKEAKGQKVTELIQFEYIAQGLGLNSLVGKYGDLPMLDYRRVDAKHPGQLPAPPYAPDAERDALQEQVIERLSAVEGEPEELPKPPAEWKQEPVLDRYFYQAKGNLPFAILADRPAKPLSLTPGPWPALQQAALDKLQSDTPYPFFTSPTEKVRYLVLADDTPDGTIQTPATIVVDRGEAVDVSPKIERHADGLTMHMRIPRTNSPWLILRQSLVRGWSCTVDDVAVPIARADGVWMAIPLPSDKEATIELRYTVPGLTLGRWISVAMAALWLVLGIIGMRSAGRFSSNAPSPATADAAPPDPK